MSRSEALREQILSLVSAYHSAAFEPLPFAPGVTPVPVSGKVHDDAELRNAVEASLDFWLTAGRYAEQLEAGLGTFVGVAHALLCNSGSSANLLALSALTSERLGSRRLTPGQEVVTVAAGFPTTVNPIVQNGLVPVFVDVELGTYDVQMESLHDAIGPKTGAIILAHTLGNPFDAKAVRTLADEKGLWFVEDNCDALGSTFDGRPTGTFGDLATVSFYPAHHITTGEGGCVLTSRGSLKKIVESFRDWGRDCWCLTGADNTCGRRFDWQLGDLPYGYDHKYTYSHVGYNLKLTDWQAAIGVAQLAKLPGFIAARRANWQRLSNGLKDLDQFFILPHATPGSDPSWFGFAMTVRPDAPFSRHDVVQFLEERRIATRQLFAGNLLRQPAYQGIPHRTVGPLTNSDLVTTGALWLGVFPGLTDAMLDYVIESVHDFVAANPG